MFKTCNQISKNCVKLFDPICLILQTYAIETGVPAWNIYSYKNILCYCF